MTEHQFDVEDLQQMQAQQAQPVELVGRMICMPSIFRPYSNGGPAG